MAKIDKTGDAAIMPLHKILMNMCGQTGYTPDADLDELKSALEYIIALDFKRDKSKPKPEPEQLYLF